jgi:NAD dependent epimerase/dehydratase family enzyme
MQTILGAGGVIGTELAKSLPQFTDRIRLVGRHPRKVNAGDELFEVNYERKKN